MLNGSKEDPSTSRPINYLRPPPTVTKRLSVNDSDSDETSSLLPTTNRLYGQVNNFEDSILDGSVEVEVKDDLSNKTQSSLVTIFSMWNTMMGTSLLSMPWALKQAGFATGIIILLFMTAIMAYTSYRVVHSVRSMTDSVVSEFSDVVRIYFGRVFEAGTLFCSVLIILGGGIVYWILMSNFLYNIVLFIYDHIHDNGNSTGLSEYHDPYQTSVYAQSLKCKNETDNVSHGPASFRKIWNMTSTVPLFLILVLFPLINFKSPTFFTKFNSLGTLSVTYLVVFICVKAWKWGLHFDMNPADSSSAEYVPNFSWTFPALSGVGSLALFLQNAVIAIVRHQKRPENTTRDLVIAYVLVCITYTFVGIMFYISFPMDKNCIADNLLNNLTSNDIMSFVARIGLFFQMTCVFPLLLYVMRTQLLHFLFKSIWPSFKHVFVFNVVSVTIFVLFAVFMPNVGKIISFVGAFCGLTYGIALPCLVYIMSCHQKGNLTLMKLIFHGFLIAVGLANFIAQFIIMGKTS